MSAIWSEDNAFKLWLDVEIAASQAWSDEGVVPAADMKKFERTRNSIELLMTDGLMRPNTILSRSLEPLVKVWDPKGAGSTTG